MNTRHAVLILALLCLSGCAGAGFNTGAFQNDLVQGRYPEALSQLEAFSDDDVSALLDRGLLLQAQGHYAESNLAFAVAEERIEDLYTRSLSKEVLSLLTSDRALDYRASGFEHAYVAYYRAWNYLELGQRDDVLVEARKINERLTFRSQSCADVDGACGHDLFLRYFSGLLFEWGGEINDAYVAYKLADGARATAARWGVREPPDLGPRLVRLARRMGFHDEAELFAERYRCGASSSVRDDSLSVVLILENGVIGVRRQVSALIPIMTGETKKIADDRDAWSRTLSRRRNIRYEKAKLEYLLRISLPEFADHPPRARQAELWIASQSVHTTRGAALSTLAAESLDQAMGGIVVRAISRGLVKYLAKQAADKKLGEGGGLLVNLLGAGLESADTRSWRALPNEIQMACLRIPQGKPEARLIVRDGRGLALEERVYSELPVAQNGIVFLRHRSVP